MLQRFNSVVNTLSLPRVGDVTRGNSDSNSGLKHDRTEQLLEKNGNLNNDQFKEYVYNGVKYIYVMPLNEDDGLNILADSIKNIDFNGTRVAVVCEHAVDAENMHKQLGKRSVPGFLINKPHKILNMALSLWTEGLLNTVLIFCDDMLHVLSEYGNIKVNFLINSTHPLPHVYQMRIQILTQISDSNIKVMVMETPVVANSHMETTAILTAGEQQNKLPPLEPTVVKDMVKDDLLPNQSLTEHESLSEDSKSECSQSYETVNGYTYNNFNTFAWSRRKQVACFNIRELKNIDSVTIQSMKAMNIGYDRAKCVQRYTWPHVAAGRSMCVVGHKASGKTWCYLPWICQHINQQAQLRTDNTDDYGPSCIILCATEQQANQIVSWCRKLVSLSDVDFNSIVKLFDYERVAEVGCILHSPCGILLTSMELLLELREYQCQITKIFNPSSIRFVVIDNLDIMWRAGRLYCENSIQWLLDTLCFNDCHTRLLITGRLWSEVLMQQLLPRLPDILILFEDALEATIYGGVKLDLIYNTSKQYQPDIVRLLEDKIHKKQRVIVACQNTEDALQLNALLLLANINNVVMENRNQTSALNELYAGKVLIANDDALPKIQAERIDCLVHYTISASWQRFKERFRVFFGNYEVQQKTKETSTSVVFIRSIEQIWFLCDFLYKHDTIPNPDWLSTFNSHRIESERLSPRSDESLCRQLLNYGNCCRRLCNYRHILWDYETSQTEHPKEGEIQFIILFVHSPSRLAVKRTNHVIVDRFLKAPVTKLGKNIQVYYEKQQTKLKHENPKVGDVCIVQIKKQYQRVVVIRIHSADRVEVKQVDAGVDFLYVKDSELLKCEKQFENAIFEAIELRVTGIMPFNMERIWSEDVKRFVRNNFFTRLNRKTDRVFTAKIDFTFHDSIYVKNVYDEDGNDLKSFLLTSKIKLQMDEDVQMRLKEAVANAKPTCK